MRESLRTDPNALDNEFRIEQLDIRGTQAESTLCKSLEVVDIQPSNQKDAIPTLWAPAWACTLPVYKKAITELSGLGRRVVSLDHPRVGGSITAATEKDLDRYPADELRKAFNLLAVLKKKEIEKTDVIAHSEGCMNTLIAAMIEPERFRGIVLYAPPGLVGQDTFWRLLKGFLSQGQDRPSMRALPVPQEEREQAAREGRTIADYKEIPLSEEKEIADIAAKEFPSYVLKNPLRALSEGLAMANFRMEDILTELHHKGVQVTIMSPVDDPVFRADAMQKMVSGKTIRGFVTVRGGHGDIGGHPELYVGAAESLLSQMAIPRDGTSA
jgi:pimeloyl-ACP methyl ester carboxylesterase